MIKNISNLGDAALYCDFGSKVNKEINSKVIQYFKNIKEQKIEGITNIAPSYNKLIISFDMKVTNFNNLKEKIENLDLKELTNKKKNVIKIPLVNLVSCKSNASSISLDFNSPSVIPNNSHEGFSCKSIDE